MTVYTKYVKCDFFLPYKSIKFKLTIEVYTSMFILLLHKKEYIYKIERILSENMQQVENLLCDIMNLNEEQTNLMI